jgi:hypothetical protein
MSEFNTKSKSETNKKDAIDDMEKENQFTRE